MAANFLAAVTAASSLLLIAQSPDKSAPLVPQSNGRYRVDVEVRGSTCRMPDPIYTKAALEKKIQGTVVVVALKTPAGSLIGRKIIKGLGYGLDEEALSVVRRMECQPCNILQSDCRTFVEVYFRLSQEMRGLAPSTNGIFKVDGVTAPTCKLFDPKYTPEALAKKVTGKVVLTGTRTTSGTIVDLKVVKTLGYGLDDEALKAAKLAQCQPCGSSRSRCAMTIEMNFAPPLQEH